MPGHGGFSGRLAAPAARLALDNITKVEVLEYPELGMEAVWKIDVVDTMAFIVVDDKGNDFFEQVRAEARAHPVAVTWRASTGSRCVRRTAPHATATGSPRPASRQAARRSRAC